MSPSIILRILLLLFICAVVPASDSIPLVTGTWTPIGPAPAIDGSTGYGDTTSGRITAIAAHPADPNTFYAGSAGGGVWKTSDAGQTWTALTDSQASLFTGAIAIAPSNPSVVYVGTGEANNGPAKELRERRYNIYSGRGILKSTDDGASWTLLGGSVFNRRAISRIAVSPVNENVVYVAVGARPSDGLDGNFGVWRSTDGGNNWTNTTAKISTTVPVSDVVIDPTNPNTLFAAFGDPKGSTVNGVYRSTDGGATWTSLSLGGTQSRYGRTSLALAPSDPKTVFVVIAQASLTSNSLVGVYKSTNGGTTWRRLAISVNDKFCEEFGVTSNILAVAGDYHQAIAVDPANPSNVYLAGLCLISSTDGGENWSLAADGVSAGPHRDHHALAFAADGTLLDGSDGGIWQLADANNLIWNSLNSGLQLTQFVGLATDPTNPNRLVGGTQDTGTQVFYDSVQWSRSVRGDGGATVIDPTRPARVYQVLEESSELFARSLDGGNSFTLKRAVVPDVATEVRLWYFPLVADPTNGARVLIGTYRLWSSTDAGVTWKSITAANQRGWQSSDPISAIAYAPSDPKTVYASAGGHVFVTTDITAATPSWTSGDIAEVKADLQQLSALVVNPQDPASLCAVRNTYTAGQVFCSANGGKSWNNLSGDLPKAPVLSLAIDYRVSPAVLYAGTLSGVFASTDGGAHWLPYGASLPNTAVPVLTLQGDTLTAATHGRGAWQILVN